MFYDQSAFEIRCEWGSGGVQRVAVAADIVIIVDVLSFSTCVDVAVSRGATVFPYRWRDERAAQFAAECRADLAGKRGQPGCLSLSPASMLNVKAGTRIVLPSPNGSELTAQARVAGRCVLAGCFRNARVIANRAAERGTSFAVIPCGERWADDTLRPAVEDLVAAGAIIAELPRQPSPEAQVALAAWHAVRNNLSAFLESCSSGRELIERGFADDVRIAAELNVSNSVPMLCDGAYVRS